MHTPQFHDSVHASSPRQQGQFPLFLRIGHAQTQRLHVSIELRNRIQQIRPLPAPSRFSLESVGEGPIQSRIAASNLGSSERLPDVPYPSAARTHAPGKSLKSTQPEWFGADALGFRFQRRVEEMREIERSIGQPLFRGTKPEVRNRPAGQIARHHARCAGTRNPVRQGCPKPQHPSLRPISAARRPQFLPNVEKATPESAKRPLHRPRSSLHPRLAPSLPASPAGHDRNAAIKMRRVSSSAGSL